MPTQIANIDMISINQHHYFEYSSFGRSGWVHNQLTGHNAYWRQFSGRILKIHRGGGGNFYDFSLPAKKIYLLENAAINYNIRILENP